jgi:hypothetical protein
MSDTDHDSALFAAKHRRARAAQGEREALDAMNAAVRAASADGVSAIRIANIVGTSRQRVYEILRER